VPAVVLRRSTPARLYATLPLHSISIGPASAANPGGLLQVVVSKARKHANLPRLLLPRASDTTLGLPVSRDLGIKNARKTYDARDGGPIANSGLIEICFEDGPSFGFRS